MKVVLFTVTILIAIVIAGALIISKNGNTETCTGSDRADPSIPGTARGTNGKFTDRCDSNGNLIEYYCNGNSVDFVNVYCGGKCVNGACPFFSKCQFNENETRRIILRFDNIQDFWGTTEINLIQTILDKNMSITLAVIPGRFGTDPLILDYISSKLNDTRITIAQEGLYHTEQEFSYLNETEAYNLAKIGIDIIKKTLHVQPIAFIVPNNIYNANTLVALSELGFKVLSAGDNENRFDGNMIIVGGTVVTERTGSSELVPVNDVLNFCRSSLDSIKVCTIILHPQDYVNNDGVTLNQTKYAEFSELLDGLETLNATFSSFNQMIQCG